MESQGEGFKPPYMSFQTFWNFIGELGNKPLPPAIDRSMMSNKSGTDQANLTSALTSFGLIDQAGVVQDRLKDLTAADDDGRKAILADMVRENYPGPVAISADNATEAALHESFKDNYNLTAAETRRKCETFFLHALRTAGLPVSPHFKQTRAGSGAPGTPKPKRSSTTRKNKGQHGSSGGAGEGPGFTPGKPAAGDTYAVELASGGTVSVVVSVNLFALTTDDRDFVIDLVDKLKGYPKAAPLPKPEGAPTS